MHVQGGSSQAPSCPLLAVHGVVSKACSHHRVFPEPKQSRPLSRTQQKKAFLMYAVRMRPCAYHNMKPVPHVEWPPPSCLKARTQKTKKTTKTENQNKRKTEEKKMRGLIEVVVK